VAQRLRGSDYWQASYELENLVISEEEMATSIGSQVAPAGTVAS